MARFDIYRMPDANGYLLDIQASILGHLETRLVVPLLPPSVAPRPARHLNPSFHIGTDEFVMVTQFMATVPRSTLTTVRDNLSKHHDEIINAVGFLMQGF